MKSVNGAFDIEAQVIKQSAQVLNARQRLNHGIYVQPSGSPAVDFDERAVQALIREQGC